MEDDTIVLTVGIDVPKDHLDIAVHPSGEQFNVDNDFPGGRAMVRRLRPIRAHAIAIEASGG